MRTDPEYEIIDGRTNTPLDVETALGCATSGEEIHRLLSVGNAAKPSGTLRRRWLKAAAASYTRIAAEVAGCSAVSSKNLEKTGENL